MDNSENVHIITATEAARSFSDLLHRVHYQHQSFIIKKGSKIMARIVPEEEEKLLADHDNLLNWLQRADRPKLSPEDCDDYDALLKETRAMKVQTRSWDE